MPEVDPEFHRTNINLFSTDVEWLKLEHGYGWTEKVRDLIHDYIRQRKEAKYGRPSRG